MLPVLRRQLALTTLLTLSTVASAQDTHNDGVGDTPEKPDILVTPTENGAMYTPGDNQPVEVTKSGNTEYLNYDTQPNPNSDIVITGESSNAPVEPADPPD